MFIRQLLVTKGHEDKMNAEGSIHMKILREGNI